MGDLLPILWLCGPPGVGKTTIGWHLYTQLVRNGTNAGYVDIDQLGICYPEPPSDPGQHRMKTRNLGAVTAHFQAAGAHCVVVSGITDTTHGVDLDQLPHAALTVCRLRADRNELAQRLTDRRPHPNADQVEEALREADEMDATTYADICLDTTGRSVADIARQITERTDGWPAPSRSTTPDTTTSNPAGAADGPVLWLCGATGAGTSTVGFTIYQRALRTGLATAYIDLDQISFYSPAEHRTTASTLASMWQTYPAAGAQALVMVGPVQDHTTVGAYADALPTATITLCWLHAGRDELTQRINQRGHGHGWAQPGDPLKGQSSTHLLAAVNQAVADAEALERQGIGLRIDTDHRTVDDIADTVLARSGWPRSPAVTSTDPT